MSSMHRRRFLQLAGLSGLSMTAARGAQPYTGLCFITVQAVGGWDTTALMDPKGTPRVNRLYREDEILEVGQIRHAPTRGRAEGGMTNEQFFSRYGSELLVVNGIDMSANNHTPCTRYMATGSLASQRYPCFSALVAACLGGSLPLAYMGLYGEVPTGGIIAPNQTLDMPALVNLAHAEKRADGTPWRPAAATDLIDEALGAADVTGLAATDRARAFVRQAQESAADLRWMEPHVPARVPADGLQEQIEVALAAFASGSAVSASVGAGGFDSHRDNDAGQMTAIPRLLEGIDYLMTRATTLGLHDRLVVILDSEMGRTPWYNQDEGKDHWAIGSLMFMGAGITGNRVVGGTRLDPVSGEEQAPMSVDPRTLQLDANGIRLRPEHIHDALRELAGVRAHPHARRHPLALPESERLLHLFE